MAQPSAANGPRPTRTVRYTSTALALAPAGQAQWTKTPSAGIPSSPRPVPAASNVPAMQQMQTHLTTQILTKNGSNYTLKLRFPPSKRAGAGFTGLGTASLLPSGVGGREWQQVYYLPKHMNRSSNVVMIFLILATCRRIIELFLDIIITNVPGYWILAGFFVVGAKGHASCVSLMFCIGYIYNSWPFGVALGL